MVKRVIGEHWTCSPQMQALAREEQIETFTLPAGAIMLLTREIGAGVDLEQDLLARMAFRSPPSPALRSMDARHVKVA